MSKMSVIPFIQSNHILKRTMLKTIFLCVSGTLFASPTSYDYEKCNTLAVAYLEHCLTGNEDACWQRSKLSYQVCRDDIAKSYSDIKSKRVIAETISKSKKQ